MSQQEIYEFLKANPGKEFSSGDIKNNFPHLSSGTINVNLKRLTKSNDIYRKIDARSPMRAFIYVYHKVDD